MVSLSNQIPLSEAARRLGVTYTAVALRISKGQLRGGRDRYGRRYVDRRDVDRLAKSRRRKTAVIP